MKSVFGQNEWSSFCVERKSRAMYERAEVQLKLRFVLFPRPNNKTEVDMKYLLRLRKPYKPGKGFFRHV